VMRGPIRPLVEFFNFFPVVIVSLVSLIP
jgi:hypothetical protein